MAGLKKDLENPVIDAYKSESATAAMKTYTGSATGNCGGSAAYSINADTTTGVFSGTMSFTNLCENQVKVNGAVSFSGKINISTEKIESLDFSLSRVNFTKNGNSATIGGTLKITGSSPLVVASNFVVEENSKTYKLQDATIKIWDGSTRSILDLSGRFYNHDFGYVDIVTDETVKFKIYNSSFWPYMGKLTISGNNSSATITANNSTTYTVVVTESGTVTSTTTHNWSEL
jgi:hypothetical protein